MVKICLLPLLLSLNPQAFELKAPKPTQESWTHQILNSRPQARNMKQEATKVYKTL